jgi:hypothetical protein
MSELKFSEGKVQMKLEPGADHTEIFSQLANLENQFGVHTYPEHQVVAAADPSGLSSSCTCRHRQVVSYAIAGKISGQKRFLKNRPCAVTV